MFQANGVMCSIYPLPTQVRDAIKAAGMTETGDRRPNLLISVEFFFFYSITIIMSQHRESQDGHNMRPR